MAYVITQPCCNDASCVAVCPVACIHPTPDEPGYGEAEMLYIDGDVCIDCGACVDVCPVEAIFPDDELTPKNIRYLEINAHHFENTSYPPRQVPPKLDLAPVAGEKRHLRVAIVGSGPAACYAAEELLARRGLDVEVNMFERLPTPWGLVRSGVAPDHPGTKAVTDLFKRTVEKNAFNFFLNVEVGTHISHEELLEHHHAVIYAVGASVDRRLGIPGEDLTGSAAALDFVGWYNGHPDFADLVFDLSCERAVVIGNGNVALDIARILVSDVGDLSRTDIADHALEALADSSIREVVVIGRRGPAQAGYSTPELLALGHLRGVDVVAAPAGGIPEEPVQSAMAEQVSATADLKARIADEYSGNTPTEGNRRIQLRFLMSPQEVLGEDRVRGLRVVHNEFTLDEMGGLITRTTGQSEDIECGLVLRAIGSRGTALPGLPFDEQLGTISNIQGRVVDPVTREPQPGSYVAGWIKRGPSGVIGSNKKCAADTVRALIEDMSAGQLQDPPASGVALSALVHERQPEAVDFDRWMAIDRHEVAEGLAQGRPRKKLVRIERMLDVAATATSDVS